MLLPNIFLVYFIKWQLPSLVNCWFIDFVHNKIILYTRLDLQMRLITSSNLLVFLSPPLFSVTEMIFLFLRIQRNMNEHVLETQKKSVNGPIVGELIFLCKPNLPLNLIFYWKIKLIKNLNFDGRILTTPCFYPFLTRKLKMEEKKPVDVKKRNS